MTYAMLINVFFVLVETFTVFYAAFPEHMEHFEYLSCGLGGNHILVPWMWLSAVVCDRGFGTSADACMATRGPAPVACVLVSFRCGWKRDWA